MEQNIRVLLDTVTHPESGVGIHDGGFVDSISATPEKITVTLRFERARDPFAVKIKRRVEEALNAQRAAIGATEQTKIIVMIKEGVAPRKVEPKATTTTTAIANTIAIASGKGGVGKSSVTANLAITLRDRGFRVGVLDADIYGPSQPKMFGCEDFLPEAVLEGDQEMILPAEVQGIKLMSIGFFIKSTDPLMWRGTMASNALKQLLHQTKWGALDFLLIDLPPGTGDIHLTILNEIKFTGSVIVSTPQGVALADVVRGVEMFAHPKVNIPLLGIVENMAYFEPDDAPGKRYYIFGEGGASRYAKERGIALLGEIPIFESIVKGGDEGEPGVVNDSRVLDAYNSIMDSMLEGVYRTDSK